ncbi:MAG TPA: GNAT family N-acetyltransferase [Candidatus Lachnoclostridium stercoravium]|uniref:GNAT family N-acetyltransferase n=1 Tax=Candidatus Lachnoclostridium stercoravium TaxID=2838633 RepID=A0A9D2HL85_9FIRM|nr:GNAT family N-acetyltransferase [Candidatus Lachnoclostridium stercoravium]
MEYIIRQARPEDLDQVAEVERICFPEAEAAGRESLRLRIQAFPESFLVAEEQGGAIIGFINGAVTDKKTISDDMFEDAGLHKEDGAYQSIFGLDVLPQYRRQGIAAALMEGLIRSAEEKGRKGLILTCKERLIPYYGKFGYRNMGVSESVHGGAVWYDMIMEFEQ